MAGNSNYPTSIDTPTDPTTSSTLATVPHHLQHGLENDAIVALETKLGTGSSVASTGSFLTGTGTKISTWVNTLTSPSITTSLLDSNNNTWIGETATASAVNYVNVTNNSTGNAPAVGSLGSDTNVDLNLTSKGSGKVRDNGSSLLDFRTSFSNYVQSGGVWSATTGLAATMTAAQLWINGVEYTVSAVASHTFGASDDTYVDYTVGTGLIYTAVSNGSASPSLAANSVRLAKVVSGSSTISSITQSGLDSLNNLIYPNGGSKLNGLPVWQYLGYAKITAGNITVANTSLANFSTNLTVTVTIPTGCTAAKITFLGSVNTSGAANTANTLAIMNGATNLQQLLWSQSGVNYYAPIQFSAIVLSPTAGSTTYNVQGATGSGTLTIGAGTSSTVTSFGATSILVECC